MCDEVHLTALVSGIFVVVIIILSGFLPFFPLNSVSPVRGRKSYFAILSTE